MSLFLHSHRRRFLLPLGSVCAFWAALATPALGQNGGRQDPQVEVTDYGVVDIAVQDADLAQVLQMLSMQSRKNIISSKNVSATVTANLYDVTFYEALDAILTVNGFGYEEQGNFIYVYTREELETRKKANRKSESRIFVLDYLSATDANEFIIPLLSDAGKASYRGEVTGGIKPEMGDVGTDSYAYAAKLVVNDYPEHLERIAQLLKDLDTPAQQVLVEATILQTAVNEANAFGVDFTVLGNINFNDVISPLGAVSNLLNGRGENGVQPDDNKAHAITSNVGNTGGAGGFKVGVVSDDIAVFLRLLDEVTDSTVLARPRVMALNRQRAEVLVGARVGYLSTTATETSTTQTVEFLDTGIQLIFRPFISPNGMVRLELRPSVSEASLRTVTNADGAGVTIPDELTNELTTNVRVRDGQTLVLGGLFKESTRVTRRQVPFLGDIPILGAAFRGHDDSVQRDEIIFLITPTIMRDDVLWENGEEMLALTEMVRIGARSGLLPFSREKMTTSYNQNAITAMNEGDTELALYHINNSLRLNPSQPDLLVLRQELTGKDEKNYERSLFERMMRKEMNGHSSARPNNAAGSMSSASSSSAPAPQRDPLAGYNDRLQPDATPAVENVAVESSEFEMDIAAETTSEADFESEYVMEPVKSILAEESGTSAPMNTDEESSDEAVSFSLNNWSNERDAETDDAELASLETDDADDAEEMTVTENAADEFMMMGPEHPLFWAFHSQSANGIWWLLPSFWQDMHQRVWTETSSDGLAGVSTDADRPK